MAEVKIDIVDNTESLHDIGEFIMSYQPYQNAFLNAVVNRIGRVLVTSRMWNNPWSVFKKGYMEFGETVEEIFVNIAKPFSFDPSRAENEVFKREMPDVRAAFHTMNFQKFYKVTIQNDQLRQAFLSWQGITDLVAKIVDSLYTAMQYDEFVTMKYMIAREILNGGIFVETVPEISDANMKGIIEKMRAMSAKLEYLKPDYNMANVMNASKRDRQYLIIPADVEAKADVNVLASAFNMDRATFLGHLIEVDSLAQHDNERLSELFGGDSNYKPFTSEQLTLLENIAGVVTDIDWWMVFDNFQQFTQNYNGQGLYWQYFYHTWKTFSVSPYAPAVVFSSTTNSITGVTVTPATANVAQGTALALSAEVTGTGIYPSDVTWTMEGAIAGGTHISGNILSVAANEPVDTVLTVTATAANGTTSGSATITVIAR